jgi:hypothetical protein
MRIKTFGQPVKRNPTRLAQMHRNFVQQEVAAAAKANLVYEGGSEWASSAFCVTKPRSTKLRLVLDYRSVNAQTVRD